MTVARRHVAVGGPKPRALLAALLVEANRVVPADRLADVLWGDAPPGRAISTVQKYVHELRAALDRAGADGAVLMTRPPGYVLTLSAEQLDAARFEQLVAEGDRALAELKLDTALACLDEALGLWRGPAWAEFADQDFARVDATRLESMRAAAMEARAEAGLAAGRHAQLLADLEANVACYPLRERPRAQLMLALYRCGRQADAMRAYQEFRRYLTDEVGLEPSPSLQALDAAIATRSATLEWAPSQPRGAGDGLRSGTMTFVLTDIEDSTRVWESAPEAMRKAVARYDEIMRWVVEAHGGSAFAVGGDGFAAAFDRARDAVEAAVRAQQQLSAEEWPAAAPLRVRFGMHSGEAEERGGSYSGPAVNKAAHVMRAAHGRQVLLTATTASLVRAALPADTVLVNLGVHRLRDLSEPEPLFQVSHPGLVSAFPALRTVSSDSTLPMQRSTFVGRGAELERLGDLLGDRRLVTLTGVGGVGKTRLGVQAAAALSGRFPGGVWLIELARTHDPATVVAVARAALGASPAPGRTELASLCEHLRDTTALLVVDNCEHVLDAAAELVAEVLDRCPGVRVLCTSRERLDLAGEQVLPVRPLDPTDDALVLFEERVREVDPDVDVRGTELRDALEICRRLDGVPLALELAAARAATMTLEDIARGLDDRFRFLTAARRRSAERHQTLRAAVDWSYQLLGGPERRLLHRLAVFAGGFTAEGARAVATVPGEDLDVDAALASLVRSSMVQLDRSPAGTRYRLLETIRAYAQERLAAAGEATAVGRAHAEWAATLVDHPFEEWARAGNKLFVRLDAERDNWRAAVTFAFAHHLPQLVVRLLCNVGASQMEEAGPLATAALAMDGIDEVPGWHWLHWVIASRGAILMDVDLLAGVERFETACTSPQERAHGAPYRSVLAVVTGAGSPLAPIEVALATPGLSPPVRAYLENYRSAWSNYPGPGDIDAARRAVQANQQANTAYVPIAQAFLATALRRDHPEEAMAVAQAAVQGDLDAVGPFGRVAVVSSTALAVADVPVEAAAAHLRLTLSGLQPILTGSEKVYFAVCANVLARAGHPAAATVRSFVLNHGLTPTYAVLLPDLPDAPAPGDMPALTTLLRAALDDLLPGAAMS